MTLLFAFPEQASLEAKLLKSPNFKKGTWEWRHFPDGESYVRVLSDLRAQPTAILCSLNRPDEKTLPLIFLARTLKELRAGKITLIAPYLGYMRQDKRFKDGEAVTSEIFANLISSCIDKIVTIDPHLHRHARLEEVYSCTCMTLTAASLMADWIVSNVQNPLIVGPDMESEQWVKSVAGQANAPYVVLTKTRHSDRYVEISLPDLQSCERNTPVLIDDIVSTGTTVIKAIQLLRNYNCGPIVCLVTHGIFAGDAYRDLLKLENLKVVTSNTIPHDTNSIDITPLLLNDSIIAM